MNCIKCNSLLNPRWESCLVCGEPTTKSTAADRMPVETGSGVREWIMESPIIGRVSLAYDAKKPDQVMVNGVAYGRDEVKTLLDKGLSADDLRAAHEVKRTFEGTVAKGV